MATPEYLRGSGSRLRSGCVSRVSIVMGARGRPNATRRALKAYSNFSYPDWELLFIDVLHSGVNLVGVYDEFKDKLPIRYLSLEESYQYIPDKTTWTPATTWNYGIKQSSGDFVITCSADIIPSHPDMIERFLDQYEKSRISVLTYFLDAEMTNSLDNLDYVNESNMIQSLPGFWDRVVWGGMPNKMMGAAGLTTFITGQPREMWEYVGMFRTELSHLVNDQDIMLRDVALGRGVGTLIGCCGYHQAHLEPSKPYGKNIMFPGWTYQNEMQARLLEPAIRDTA
jgi:hypothetical protein